MEIIIVGCGKVGESLAEELVLESNDVTVIDLSSERINQIKEIESKCKNKKIEIITSSPTFEIWFLMHFRNSNLTFESSEKVKKEYKKLREKTPNFKELLFSNQSKAIKFAKRIENNSDNDYYTKNPHSSFYKIIELIKSFSI